MFDRAVMSSFVMFICVCVLGCLATQAPVRFDPIEPVPAATVERVAVQEAAPKIEPTITMHSGENCPPCALWIARDMQNWKKLGWRVEVLKETTSARLWPWYEIMDGDGLRFEVDGALDRVKYERARKKALGNK